MIKILHVISDTGIGGAGVLLCNLLSCSDRTRFDISAVVPRDSLLAPRIRALDIRVIETEHGADRSADMGAIPELCRILRAESPYILHTHSALYARIAGFFCHVPICVNTRHCADMNERPSLLLRTATGGLERLLKTHTIATADYVKDVLTARGVPKNRIHVIRNGSQPKSRLTEDQKAEVRRKLGISETDFTVGMVARLEKEKGHDVFLRAAKYCTQKSDRIRFLVVGDGSRATALKRMARELGISDRVIFTGFCADVTPIMNILHLNINCSDHSETSSLSLSEGMSVGSVPVVSDCGGNAYMAGFGKNGIVFPVGDSNSLAGHILALSEDRNRLETLSQNCRTRFAEEFTALAMTKKAESLYQSLSGH